MVRLPQKLSKFQHSARKGHRRWRRPGSAADADPHRRTRRREGAAGRDIPGGCSGFKRTNVRYHPHQFTRVRGGDARQEPRAATAMHIDLNSDVGESFGAYAWATTPRSCASITSANVACGFHAGDPGVMRRTVQLARDAGVAIGAHPGFPDLVGFGRREHRGVAARGRGLRRSTSSARWRRSRGRRRPPAARQGARRALQHGGRAIGRWPTPSRARSRHSIRR